MVWTPESCDGLVVLRTELISRAASIYVCPDSVAIGQETRDRTQSLLLGSEDVFES